jgi:hypothetical protein
MLENYDEVKRGVDTLALLLRGWADVDLRAATSGAKS